MNRFMAGLSRLGSGLVSILKGQPDFTDSQIEYRDLAAQSALRALTPDMEPHFFYHRSGPLEPLNPDAIRLKRAMYSAVPAMLYPHDTHARILKSAFADVMLPQLQDIGRARVNPNEMSGRATDVQITKAFDA